MEHEEIVHGYDPGLRESNTGSRKAANPVLDQQLAHKIASLSVDEIMTLANKRQGAYQQIHENIRNFYYMGGSISREQKATMATFLLDHGDLFGQQQDHQVEEAPAEQVRTLSSEEIAALPKTKDFGEVQGQLDPETGQYVL